MFHFSRAALLACAATLALAACGGGGSTGSTPAAAPLVPGSQQRHTMSIPCTPDSYGYCYVRTGKNLTLVHCPPGPGGYISGTITYEVYNATTDLGTYTLTDTGTCTDGSETSWSPDEPSVEYSDPNLP